MRTRSRRGSSYATLVVSCFVLLGFVAMGVDWGAVAVARNQAQTAADAAAMAAVGSLDDQVVATVRAGAFASEVQINGVSARVDPTDVQFGHWDAATAVWTWPTPDPNAVRVIAHATIEMPFTRLYGIDTLDVVSVAGAAPAVSPGRAPDVVIALDVTGSMDDEELADERDAAQALITCIHERAAGNSRAAIAVFTGVDHTLLPMSSYDDSYTTMVSTITGLQGCGNIGAPPCSGTNQAAGLGGARHILENAATPADIGQVVVLFSDGAPNSSSICNATNFADPGIQFDLTTRCAALGPAGTQPNNSDSSPNDGYPDTYYDWAMDERSQIMAEGAEIYTVYYSRDDTSGTDFMHGLASDPGKAFDAPNSDDIAARFEEICVRTTTGAPGLIF